MGSSCSIQVSIPRDAHRMRQKQDAKELTMQPPPRRQLHGRDSIHVYRASAPRPRFDHKDSAGRPEAHFQKMPTLQRMVRRQDVRNLLVDNLRASKRVGDDLICRLLTNATRAKPMARRCAADSLTWWEATGVPDGITMVTLPVQLRFQVHSSLAHCARRVAQRPDLLQQICHLLSAWRGRGHVVLRTGSIHRAHPFVHPHHPEKPSIYGRRRATASAFGFRQSRLQDPIKKQALRHAGDLPEVRSTAVSGVNRLEHIKQLRDASAHWDALIEQISLNVQER
mmetsp:Transcript_14042/g.52652  ORF Transcript_14042/g.52652 Transcript_14042/m.52652 type:complete len:282 (-) Transcript_14042:1699-2544(-)